MTGNFPITVIIGLRIEMSVILNALNKNLLIIIIIIITYLVGKCTSACFLALAHFFKCEFCVHLFFVHLKLAYSVFILISESSEFDVFGFLVSWIYPILF